MEVQTSARAEYGGSHEGRLSEVSKLYDVNNDGRLDEAEAAMRAMDKTGRGYLTNDKVYHLMKEHINTQEKLLRSKRLVFGLVALVVLLALSNLGTSIAAAYLSKDTKVNSGSDLVNKRTNDVIGTATVSDNLAMRRVATDSEGRRLADAPCPRTELPGGDVFFDCLVDSQMFIDDDTCDRLLKKCSRGGSVNLVQTLRSGAMDSTEICPLRHGQLSSNLKSRVTNQLGSEIVITRVEGGCDIEGLEGGEGDMCDTSADCKDDLSCYLNKEESQSCSARCRRLRFAKHRGDMCVNECMQPKCTSVSAGSQAMSFADEVVAGEVTGEEESMVLEP
mmetsp:Transcript_16387/g.36680  ORF Transcript_16387/g.36680 Transcript_16387/m.36680 type:complete len:334 (-) Transcript_16387:51-1052(-)